MTERREESGPDYRFTLANERTYLAWLRTSLGITAGGFAVTHVLPDLSREPELDIVGVVLMGLGALIPPLAHRHWKRVQVAIGEGVALPPHWLPTLIGFVLMSATLALVILQVSG